MNVFQFFVCRVAGREDRFFAYSVQLSRSELDFSAGSDTFASAALLLPRQVFLHQRGRMVK